MKKVYQEPQILIENFRLTDHIMAQCSFRVNLSDVVTTCFSEDISGGGGEIVFTTYIDYLCTVWSDTEGNYEGICYNMPEGTTFFVS